MAGASGNVRAGRAYVEIMLDQTRFERGLKAAQTKRRSFGAGLATAGAKTLGFAALAAAVGIDGMKTAAVFSVGSDGTDGPTDAAGGYVDGGTALRLRSLSMDPVEMLNNNDAYHALQPVGGLIMTGPTGTNVNDLTVVLIRSASAGA